MLTVVVVQCLQQKKNFERKLNVTSDHVNVKDHVYFYDYKHYSCFTELVGDDLYSTGIFS